MKSSYADELAASIRRILLVLDSDCIRTDQVRAFIADPRIQFTSLRCICGRTDAEVVVATVERNGIPLDTRLCLHCGLMRSDPYYTDHALEVFYQEYYRSIYTAWRGEDAVEYIFSHEWKVGEQVNSLLRDTDCNVEGPIVEIGCGAGGTLSYFHSIGYEVHGCDYDDTYLQRGASAGVKVYTGGVETVSHVTDAGLLIMHYVLEHLRDPVGMLRRCKQILRPDGILYVGVPGVMNIGNQYENLGSFFQNAHAWHFCLDTLEFVASLAGYRLVSGDETIAALFKADNRVRPNLPRETIGLEILRYLNGVSKQTRFSLRRRVLKACLTREFRNLFGGRLYSVYRTIKRGLGR